MEVLIKADSITKSYNNNTAVKDLSLSVASGEIVAFLGINGAGKTTTLKMLTGILLPDQGSIEIAGINLLQDPIAAKKITGYIPDHPQLYDKLSASEFLDFCADLYQVPSTEKKQRITELLTVFGLQNRHNHLIESFSHGMKQRLATCSALIHNPKVLIIDEPIVGLDPHGAKLLISFLRSYANQGNCVFLSTHTLNVAEKLADRIVIIDRGELKTAGTIQQIRLKLGTENHLLEDLFIQITKESYAIDRD